MLRIQDFAQKKAKGEKISMVTCYDYTFARILADSEVDCLLVGDSLAMTMHGHSSTLPATIPMMVLHTSAVVRGASNKFIVADVPFLASRKGLTASVNGIGRLMQAGAHAVKIEGAKGNLELITHLVDSGIPVMGHLGLTPQSVNTLGGFRVQGKTAREHDQIYKDALAMEQAGCFALVLECIPKELAKEISRSLTIPTIGIGAGPETDGQVLVLQDMLGMGKDFHPKFLRTYMNGFESIKEAFNHYHRDVMTTEFPSEKESY
jgi:3-methyl-2-oxobutanoate hydroxymethyltransferase